MCMECLKCTWKSTNWLMDRNAKICETANNNDIIICRRNSPWETRTNEYNGALHTTTWIYLRIEFALHAFPFTFPSRSLLWGAFFSLNFFFFLNILLYFILLILLFGRKMFASKRHGLRFYLLVFIWIYINLMNIN